MAGLNREMSSKDTENEPTADGGFTEPVPHHVSDVGVWGHADRNYFVFVALTFLFGLFGVDHMYLRSNSTAFKKLLLNIFGLGIWYFWDIIQVLKDGRTVRQHGLNSPFDWIRGIGRGMFVPLPMDGGGSGSGKSTSSTNKNKKNGEKEWAAPKSYFIYTLLAIGLGAFGADKFYLGKTWQGAAKIFSVFNIFLFLFGILWVVWDAVHAYFMTESILKDGVTAPLPFSWFFSPVEADIFKVVEVKEEEAPSSSGWSFPSFSLPFSGLYKELVVPILQPTVGSAIQNANKIASVATGVAALGNSALGSAPGFVGNLTGQMEQQAVAAATNAAASSPVGTTVEAVQAIANAKAKTNQTGGGSSSSGPGPILAGALTAILIAGGLKGTYDFVSKQVVA